MAEKKEKKKEKENSEYKRVVITTLKRKKNSKYNRVVITTLKKELYAFSNLISEWKKHLLVNTQHVISSQTNENNKQVLH